MKPAVLTTSFACALVALGCEAPPAVMSDGGDSRPELSADDWERLRALAPVALPPPPRDVSNRWADDPRAAALGRALFFDPGLSGALLDADNDGGPNSLGVVGETGRVACAGCHMEGAAFGDTRSTFQQISLGAGWTHRRTPSLLDVAQAPLYGWGGRHSTLHSQIFAPLENPLEMNSSRLYVALFVAEHHRTAYEALFGEGALTPLGDAARFPRIDPGRTGCRLTRSVSHPRVLPPDPLYECHGMPGDGAEFDAMEEADQALVTRVVINVGKAIAAFERTLRCPPGRFDAFVHGDHAALSASEQRGLALFIGRGRCTTCHSGPYLTDQRFHSIGLAESATREGIVNDGDRGAARDVALAITDPLGVTSAHSDGDDGRLPATVPAAYEGAFRTPSLRCVSQRPSFMHSGLLESLDHVVRFFDRGGDVSGYPGRSEISPLGLREDERRDLVAFLRAL